MVRLKGAIEEMNLQKELSFQFLMVRLKERFVNNKGGNYEISIPYGAIKSATLISSVLSIVYFNSLWCD